MQAIVDNKRRFIDVDILHLGASSDHLVFAVSNLERRLEQGLLAFRKVIFGDNAYINTKFMVTPFKNPTKLQDNYSFYHSQLRINVGCSFGMLVHWWSILQQLLPAVIGIHKITAMTVCLCKLHNFLID